MKEAIDERVNEILIEQGFDPCMWYMMAQDEQSTTFKDVKAGHKLYDCYQCSGKPNSCPNYGGAKELLNNYSLER